MKCKKYEYVLDLVANLRQWISLGDLQNILPWGGYTAISSFLGFIWCRTMRCVQSDRPESLLSSAKNMDMC